MPFSTKEIAELKPFADSRQTPWMFDPENYGITQEPGFGLLTEDGGILGVTVHFRKGVTHEAMAALAEKIIASVNALPRLLAEAEEANKLAAFKTYVHQRLDDAGVPVDPDSPHKAAGCRIGGRLDWVLGKITRLQQRVLTAAGDDLCRLSQEEIKDLTSGKVPIPPKADFLASCGRFHDQIAGESGVNENCLTLAQMVAENERLETEAAGMREALEKIDQRLTMIRVLARLGLTPPKSATCDIAGIARAALARADAATKGAQDAREPQDAGGGVEDRVRL